MKPGLLHNPPPCQPRLFRRRPKRTVVRSKVENVGMCWRPGPRYLTSWLNLRPPAQGSPALCSHSRYLLRQMVHWNAQQRAKVNTPCSYRCFPGSWQHEPFDGETVRKSQSRILDSTLVTTNNIPRAVCWCREPIPYIFHKKKTTTQKPKMIKPRRICSIYLDIPKVSRFWLGTGLPLMKVRLHPGDQLGPLGRLGISSFGWVKSHKIHVAQCLPFSPSTPFITVWIFV